MPTAVEPAIFQVVESNGTITNGVGALPNRVDHTPTATTLELHSAADVTSVCAEMFGANLAFSKGVIHVAAVAADNRVLKITPATPKSPHDAFVLSMTRACADFIVTTGRILREEPDLTHDYLASAAARRAFAEWRKNVVQLACPVHVLILTSGRELDERHPIFAGPRPVTIVTSDSGRQLLRDRSWGAADVVAVDTPHIRTVINYALSEEGAGTVSVEAGPSTTAALYEQPIVTDELLLSTFHGDVSPALLGDSFISLDNLAKNFRQTSSFKTSSADGDWSFARYLR